MHRVPGADARTISLTRRLVPEDLIPQMRDEFVELCRR
jgi:hypothetical protein